MSMKETTREPINRVEKVTRELTAAGREITRLFAGNPADAGFHFPPEILEEVYGRYLRTQEYRPHPKGLPGARRAVADYYRRHGAVVDPENILITSGTSESFFYLFSLLAGPGDNLLTPNPSYPLFDEIARLARISLRHYRLDEDRGWQVDLEDLKAKADDRTRAVVLVSPNNPTGAVTGAGQLREIAAWANGRGIPLISDEVFSEFYFGEGLFPRTMAVAPPHLCFTLNGISKMFALPGLKLSWIAVTGQETRVGLAVDRLETINDTFLSCHTPIQEALPALFSRGQDFLATTRQEVRRRRDLAVELLLKLPAIRFTPPAGGFYLMAELPRDFRFSEEEFVIALMEKTGIFVHPGYFYDYERGAHFVFSFLGPPERLRQGLDRIGRFLDAV